MSRRLDWTYTPLLAAGGVLTYLVGKKIVEKNSVENESIKLDNEQLLAELQKYEKLDEEKQALQLKLETAKQENESLAEQMELKEAELATSVNDLQCQNDELRESLNRFSKHLKKIEEIESSEITAEVKWAKEHSRRGSFLSSGRKFARAKIEITEKFLSMKTSENSLSLEWKDIAEFATSLEDKKPSATEILMTLNSNAYFRIRFPDKKTKNEILNMF